MTKVEENRRYFDKRSDTLRKRAAQRADLMKRIAEVDTAIRDGEDDLAELQQRRAGLRNDVDTLDALP